MKYIFLFLFLLPFSSAMNIEMNYSDSVSFEEKIEFDICILNSSEVFDLKIDILKDDERISRILNSGEWKSSMYYLNDAISDCNKFYLNITKDVIGEAKIIIKFRNSKDKIFTFSNYSIEILKAEVEKVEELQEGDTEEDMEIDIRVKNADEHIKDIDVQRIINNTREQNTREIIVLNPKAIKTNEDFKKSYKDYVKYAFVAFCILIGILYAIKPKKKENEFR